MKNGKETGLNFEIDNLTNSIENSLTGENFDTEVTRILRKDSKQIKKRTGILTGTKNLWNRETKFINLQLLTTRE